LFKVQALLAVHSHKDTRRILRLKVRVQEYIENKKQNEMIEGWRIFTRWSSWKVSRI